MNISSPLTVAEKLASTLEGLMRAVAACSNPRRPGGPLAVWLIRLIWTRVSVAHRRIQRLLKRFQEGRLRVVGTERPAVTGREGRRQPRAATLKGVPRAEGKVPRRFAWLLPLVPCEAANYASQLRLWLAEPEMVALLMASPQARLVLGPLCRMLGIEAELLTPMPGAPVAAPLVDPPEVAVAWNLGVVLRPVAQPSPPGDGGWRLALGP